MSDASPAPDDEVGDPSESDPGSGPAPYRNLFVPLIIVPAAIVGAIVLVFTFFGAIAGREATLQENLDRVLNGGAGEHKQAAFNMVRQIAENQRAELEGRKAPWPVDETFLPKLRQAWESSTAADPNIRYVLASLLAQLGDRDGVPGLLALLDLSDAEDPDGRVRMLSLSTLGGVSDERVKAPVLKILRDSQDDGMRVVAATALRTFHDAESAGALAAALGDPSFEVRANAAITLAVRGDPAGASVLRDLLDRAAWTAEHERDPRKYAQARRVSESRVMVVEALARLGRPEDRAAIQVLADRDDDLAVREAAMKALEGWK